MIRSIGLTALFFLMIFMAAACDDDNSLSGHHDDGTSVTCEELCEFIGGCYPDVGPTAYTYDDCMGKCDEEKKNEDSSFLCFSKCNNSDCECFFDCVDSI